MYWIDKLVDVYGLMHWFVSWCIELTCCLTFTDALTCWLCVESTCWLTLTNWCMDVLVSMLNQHVGWRLLMLWPIVWYVESTRWMTLTVLINAIIADQLLQLVIKRHKKKKLYVYYTFKAGSEPSFCCSCKVKCKTQHHLNRGMLQCIRLKQAV